MRSGVPVLALVAACGASPAPRAPPPPLPPGSVAEHEFAAETRSPWPQEGPALACGAPDAALERVASRLAGERISDGGGDPDRVTALLRAEGEPHVRPRIVSSPAEDERFRAALEEGRRARTRCGIGRARRADGSELVVAVAVDAVADLEPLPTRARTGQWLAFDADVHVPARAAKLLVLGPRGRPRTVPTALDARSGRVRARFALDEPGAFDVQLVGELDSGPTPLLEARVFADEPPRDEPPRPAPGEEAGQAGRDPTDALARMTAALRTAEDLPALGRDARLDALAAAQVAEMERAGRVAHDLGDGDPVARATSAGVGADELGENVARAQTVALAFRALYASPSHRLNLLRAEYTHVGLAAALGSDGKVYVCQIFARRTY
jgi:Cysteine-rich secretory protein family